jgi:murein DD-endopeptidase MepM/ murein hydrolase activator NlpD
MAAVPASPARGDVVRLTFHDLPLSSSSRIEFAGVLFPVWRLPNGGWEGFVVVERDTKPGPQRVAVVSGGREEGKTALFEDFLKIADRAFPEQRLSVEEKMVTLSKKDLARVERERKIIGAALSTLTEERFWKDGFMRPLEAPVSSPFGLQRFYNGKAGSYHGGIDLAAPKGTEIRASSQGRVVLAGDFFYTGNSIFVDHGLGLITAYFHMNDLSVREGDAVGPETLLGHVGSTGRSTGAHLHWSTYLCAKKADPDSLVRLTSLGVGGGENP